MTDQPQPAPDPTPPDSGPQPPAEGDPQQQPTPPAPEVQTGAEGEASWGGIWTEGWLHGDPAGHTNPAAVGLHGPEDVGRFIGDPRGNPPAVPLHGPQDGQGHIGPDVTRLVSSVQGPVPQVVGSRGTEELPPAVPLHGPQRI